MYLIDQINKVIRSRQGESVLDVSIAIREAKIFILDEFILPFYNAQKEVHNISYEIIFFL